MKVLDLDTTEWAKGACLVDLRSWGFTDPIQEGHVKVNDKLIVDLTHNEEDSTRGLHIVTLSVLEEKYKVVEVRKFDFWSEQEAEECSTFLEQQNPGTIILGASAQDISNYLEPACAALRDLGVDVSHVSWRSSIAFVAKKGDPDFMIQRVAKKGEGPVDLVHDINKSSREVSPKRLHQQSVNNHTMKLVTGLETEEYHFNLKSWGYEDHPREGHIKVNNNNVLDLSFDTNNNNRGLHLVTLKVLDGKYQVNDIAHFDFWDEDKAKDCVTFIQRQGHGTIILGASADEIYNNFSVVSEALQSIGVDVSEVSYRSSLVFIAMKGNPDFACQEWAERNQGPVEMELMQVVSSENVI